MGPNAHDTAPVQPSYNKRVRQPRDLPLQARETIGEPRYRVVIRSVLLWVVLPIALMAWAQATAGAVRIAPVNSPLLGFSLMLIGASLLLPIAARLFPHPVETAFCTICVGVSIASGSASGLWLVSPVVALGCAASVVARQNPQVRLLPKDEPSPPTGRDHLAFFLFMVLPWLALYEAVLAIGIPPDAVSGVTHFEQRLPVLEWTQIFYGSVYLMVLSVPFIAETRADLRWFSVRGLWTMLLAYPAFLVIPLIAPKRSFVPQSLPGHLLVWEQSLDSPVAAFPSFHVIWVLLAAEVYSRHWPKRKWLFYGWACLVAASCITTGQHSVADVIGGIATVELVRRAPGLWRSLKPYTERIAGTPAGAGAGIFFALWFAGSLALPGMKSETSPWLILAALSLGGALIQALAVGGTPVYLIVWNGLTAVALLRLWTLAAPLDLIAGLYLILAGLGKFVKEAGPGRLAIAMVIGGALLTALGQSLPAPTPTISWEPALPAAILALLWTLGRSKILISRSA